MAIDTQVYGLMNKKHSHWQTNLTSYLAAARKTEAVFDWGELSCAKFVSGAIEAQVGLDPHASFDGQYTDAHSAKVILKQFGYKSLLEYADSIAPRVAPIKAQFGDIVALKVRTEAELAGDAIDLPEEVAVALGVAEPPFFWLITPKGLGRLKITHPDVITAFRIG